MTTNSVLPPEAWELEQLTRLYHRRPDIVNSALRRLLAEDAELQWSVVLGAYLDQQINLGKAAELLDTPEIALRERFLELGIPLRIGSADLAEARAEVAAIRNWFGKP
jgi:predicted HTH domain antitoxin